MSVTSHLYEKEEYMKKELLFYTGFNNRMLICVKIIRADERPQVSLVSQSGDCTCCVA